ncbi:MAG: hypothetical protein ACAI38_01245 [Myxococcota bacterium]|nr:hypothetical protein [Myxococcota bacterium]
MASNTALTTNSDLLDDLVLAAARGDSLALGALEARYGGVVNRVVRARVFAARQSFISEDCAWASARLAIRRVSALQASGTPFLAWLELAAEEAFTAPVGPFDPTADGNDGIADVDRCALDLHVLGYGSFEIASVLAEPQSTVRQRIEATKQRLWARAMAVHAD